MRTKRWISTPLLLTLLALITAACKPATGTPAAVTTGPLPASPTISEPLTSPTDTPVLPAETATAPTNTPDPTIACPQPGPGQAVYTSQWNGYCFLYPGYFTPTLTTEGSAEIFTLVGPRETADPKQMELAGVSLSILSSGPAEGLDSAGYAGKYQSVLGPMLEETQQSLATIGGQPAVVVTGIPGFFTQKSAFIVANGYKYRIWLSPEPGMLPELDEHINLVWETVINSIVFMPPTNDRQYVTASQVCPVETDEARLYISERDGYCLLYPADFIADPDFPGHFKGGPVLGDFGDFPDVITSLTVGTFGFFPSQTPREAFFGIIGRADPASVQDGSIGGYPAVIMHTVDDPWDTRTAGVIVNGQAYTILGQPWEPALWPDGVPYLDRVWDTVLGSIAFFDAWR